MFAVIKFPNICKIWKMNQKNAKAEGQGENEIFSSGHSMTITLKNSQHLSTNTCKMLAQEQPSQHI